MCLIVFASRAATLNSIRSSSRIGKPKDILFSVPDRHPYICGALFVPANTLVAQNKIQHPDNYQPTKSLSYIGGVLEKSGAILSSTSVVPVVSPRNP